MSCEVICEDFMVARVLKDEFRSRREPKEVKFASPDFSPTASTSLYRDRIRVAFRHSQLHATSRAIMCGRYALGIRASFVRYQLQQQGMPVDEAPEDNEARETYNFPPGAYGLVYRADVPDHGLRDTDESQSSNAPQGEIEADEVPSSQPKQYKYQIKVMKWGLIPFWTKRAPDYGSMLRTINCRDDSLLENKGMWNTMKQRKRCLVVAQGFYEWLKKGPGGKEKIPHFVKRKDGQLMCFAGLWDCVKYEDTEEKIYTYTIITTDSNKQLSFLHDRMPVILDPGTDAIKMWLDPTRNKWSKELQMLLKPFDGELECYPVDQAVGKVGNNSASFIVPIDSKENKKNIANFFNNAAKKKDGDTRPTVGDQGSENNAPLPATATPVEEKHGEKRARDEETESPVKKVAKLKSPVKSPPKSVSKTPRSATSNKDATLKTSPAKKTEAGTQRITNFFSK
jgi:putative SOS response-associated peptidase YedK